MNVNVRLARQSSALRPGQSTTLRTFQVSLARLTVADRVHLEREGLPATVARAICRRFGFDEAMIRTLIGPSSAHARRGGQRWINATAAWTILTCVDLLNRLVAHQQSGQEEADTALRLGAWLQRPHPALGGVMPLSWIDTPTGRAVVTQLLESSISGAYR